LKRLQRILPLTAAMACIFGCSDDGEQSREYALPETLCGFGIDTALYSPIFPPGDNLNVTSGYEEYETGIMPPVAECFIDVDDESAIYIETITEDSGDSPGVAGYLSEYMGPDYDLEDGQQVAGSPRETWVWPDFVTTNIACQSSSTDFRAINVSIRLDWVKDDDYSEPLRELIEPFAAEQLRRIGERTCTPA
jgi:hypothetical protein